MKTWLARALTAAMLLAPGSVWAACAPISPYQVIPGGTTPCSVADGGALAAETARAMAAEAAAAAAGAAGAVQAAGGAIDATTFTRAGGIDTTTPAVFASRWYDVRDFGARWDGSSHPLSTITSFPYRGTTLNTTGWTLAQWQANIFPAATALTDEIDFDATQATINYAATQLTSTQGLNASIGVGIDMPNGVGNFGAGTLSANNMSLFLRGHGQFQTLVRCGADCVHFGLNNGMGVVTSTIGTSGDSYTAGDPLQLVVPNGYSCTTPPILTPTSSGVDINGSLLSAPPITTAGACPTPPPNPISFIDISGQPTGNGALFNGTWTAGALTSLAIASTGGGCAVGDQATAQGGANVGAQAVIRINTIVAGGAVPVGGYSFVSQGSYGTPPAGPVTFIPVAPSTCSNVRISLNSFNHQGGALEVRHMGFITTTVGNAAFVAQHNIAPRTDAIVDNYFGTSGATAGWGYLLRVTAGDNLLFKDNIAYNNLNVSGALAGIAAIDIADQVNLIGRYQYMLDNNSLLGFDKSVKIEQNSNNPMQGFYLRDHFGSQGTDFIYVTNAGTHGLGLLSVTHSQSQQDGYFLNAPTSAMIGLTIADSTAIIGNGRSLSIPSTCGFVNLGGVVNQMQIHHNVTGTAHNNGCALVQMNQVAGGNGEYDHNLMGNAAALPNAIGFQFGAGTNNINEGDDVFVSPYVTKIIDNSTFAGGASGNHTMLAKQLISLGPQASVLTPSGTQALFQDNGNFPRFLPTLGSGGYGQGGIVTVTAPVVTVISTTTDTPIGSTSMTGTFVGTPQNGQVVTGAAGLVAPTLITGTTGSTITFSPPTTIDIPSGSSITTAEYAGDLTLSGQGVGAVGISVLARTAPCTVTLTNGGTSQIPDGCGTVIFNNSLVSAASIYMPVNPRPYQEIKFTASLGGVTTLTVLPAPGSIQAVNITPRGVTQAGGFTAINMLNRWQN